MENKGDERSLSTSRSLKEKLFSFKQLSSRGAHPYADKNSGVSDASTSLTPPYRA